MRRPALAAGAAAAALAGAATAQPPPVTPQDFVTAVSGANAYEVMAAQLALVQSRDPAVRAFAEEMIRDHQAAEQRLAQAARAAGLPAPADIVGGDQRQLLAGLQGLRGRDFDQAYARQQRLAHAAALATEQGYAQSGSDAGLRALAAGDVAMIRHHLDEAQRLPAPAG